MNLKSAVTHEALNHPVKDDCLCKRPKVSAERIAKQIFSMAAAAGRPFQGITSREWAKKWLASDEFVLTEIEASLAAVPLTPFNPQLVQKHQLSAAAEQPPIVVDMNKRKIGRTVSGYIPPVIVVDGKHRHTAHIINGTPKVQAWVGTKALLAMTRKPVDVKTVKATATPTRMDSTLSLYAGMGTPIPRQDVGDGGSQPTMRMPAVKSTGKSMSPVTKGQKPEVIATGGGTGGPGGSTSGLNPNLMRAGGPGSGKKKHSVGEDAPLNTDNDKTPAEALAQFPVHGKGMKAAMPIGRSGPATGGSVSMMPPARSGPATGGSVSMHPGGGGGGMGVSHGRTGGNIAPTRAMLEAEDASDTDSVVNPSDTDWPPDPSDRKMAERAYRQPTTSTKPMKVGEVKKVGSPSRQSPGSGVGPRMQPNVGSSKSDLAKSGKMCAGKIPGVIRTRNKKMQAVAPPGFSEATMHELKRKHGVKNAFKIAWHQHNKN